MLIEHENYEQSKVDEARELFGDFSGHLLNQELEIDLDHLTDDDGGVIFAFGRLDTIESDDGDFMEFDPDIAPLLCSSYDGTQLYIIGGYYDIELDDPVMIKAVEYSTYRDGEFEEYRHVFDKDAQPGLESDESSNLLIVGGRYTFTDRGIENH